MNDNISIAEEYAAITMPQILRDQKLNEELLPISFKLGIITDSFGFSHLYINLIMLLFFIYTDIKFSSVIFAELMQSENPIIYSVPVIIIILACCICSHLLQYTHPLVNEVEFKAYKKRHEMKSETENKRNFDAANRKQSIIGLIFLFVILGTIVLASIERVKITSQEELLYSHLFPLLSFLCTIILGMTQSITIAKIRLSLKASKLAKEITQNKNELYRNIKEIGGYLRKAAISKESIANITKNLKYIIETYFMDLTKYSTKVSYTRLVFLSSTMVPISEKCVTAITEKETKIGPIITDMNGVANFEWTDGSRFLREVTIDCEKIEGPFNDGENRKIEVSQRFSRLTNEFPKRIAH